MRARSTISPLLVVVTTAAAMLAGSRAASAAPALPAADEPASEKPATEAPASEQAGSDPAAADAAATDKPAAQDEITPHPKRALEPGKDPEPAAAPFSFAHPYAWPLATDKFTADGYLLPQFEVADVPTALPRDRTQYGASGTSAGFAIHGTPVEGWSYMLHAIVLPAGTSPLALLSPLAPTTQLSALAVYAGVYVDVEEASLSYRPVEWNVTKVGVVRIPFSVAQTTPVPEQMFPQRAAQSQPFQSGADLGALDTVLLFEDRVQLNAGVFLGSSLGLYNPSETVHGAVLAASLEAHPLGAMSLREGDEARGSFRFALGCAGIYRSATAYDSTGYEGSHFTDERLAASARASWKGLYLQGEYLRHVQTDDISGRPILDNGGYGEGSFYLPVGKTVAFEPLVRAGVVAVGQEFASRTYTSYEGGLAFFPHAQLDEPQRLKVVVEYLTASVTPLSEVEHVGLAQVQLEW